MLNKIEKYSFKDVYIIPQLSWVNSRSQVDTATSIGNGFELIRIDVPVISSNMDSITESEMATKIYQAGGIGAIHRYMSIDDNVEEYKRVDSTGAACFVSIGVNAPSKERAVALYAAGARYFIIDIAHGHSIMMRDMLGWIKSKFDDVFVVAGNVATSDGVTALEEWGADATKVGIANGHACSTYNTTGVGYPQFSSIMECSAVARKPIIADGSVSEIGDIAKALGAGADLVMCGRFFASCRETPSIMVNGKKTYRGMASTAAMLRIKSKEDLPTPEGIMITIDDPVVSVYDMVKLIKGGLQSAFSYTGATNLYDFQAKVQFGVKK